MENVLCINPKVDTKTEEQVLALIKNIAVVPVAMGVRRADLLAIKQDSNEPARAFAAKIQGRAATCAFSTKCPTPTCTANVDFTDIIAKYVLVNGLADEDVKREVLR